MPRKPSGEIEAYIGTKIRKRREDLCITQAKLATTLNISYQQIQKYEVGKNRIPASMLYEISHQLGVPIEYFFYEIVGGK